MVAAGLLQAARFTSPNIWDVAGGIALVAAAGGTTRKRDGKTWLPMLRFEPTEKEPDLRFWRGEIIVGERTAAENMCEIHSG
jgi:myo-inositol-1(or 4)-monophosphatase